MKILGQITTVILLSIIIGCDPGGTFIFNIDNGSEYDLMAHYKINSGWGSDEIDSTMEITSGEEQEIYRFHQLGGPYDIGDGIKERLAFVELYHEDTLVYEQNPVDRDLWQYNEEKDWIGSGTATYTLEIKNEQLNINTNN